MRPILKQVSVPLVSGLIGVAVGATATYAMVTAKSSAIENHSVATKILDPFFNLDPFARLNTFEKIKMPTDSDITIREDDQFVYMDLDVQDPESTSIKTQIDNGYLTITGTLDDSDSSQGRFFKSTFTRTLPLPEDVDSEKMQLVPDGNKIVLKFPKSRS